MYGASGRVGTYAVQLAKYFGAEVTGACSTTNFDLVKSLGADHVSDCTAGEIFDAGARCDVIFETLDKSSFSACLRAVQADGLDSHITVPLPGPEMVWAKMTGKQTLILGENPPKEAADWSS